MVFQGIAVKSRLSLFRNGLFAEDTMGPAREWLMGRQNMNQAPIPGNPARCLPAAARGGTPYLPSPDCRG